MEILSQLGNLLENTSPTLSWVVFLLTGTFLIAVREKLKNLYLTIFNKIGNSIKIRFRSHIFTKRDLYRENQIQELLIQLRIINEADRSNIYLFHNGGVFTTNTPQFKISKTHESLAPGVATTFDVDKDVRCSSILNFIRPLFEADCVINGVEFISGKRCTCERKNQGNCRETAYLIDVENLDSGYSKSSLKSKGVYWSIVAPLFNLKNDIIGYCSLHYCSPEAKDTIVNNSKDICQYASDICFYLNQLH
jgi:hypothetical protein